MSLNWSAIVRESARFTSEHSPVTLRQAFYHLVSHEYIANTRSNYTQLSARTARAREAGLHGSFVDGTRTIHERMGWSSIASAVKFYVSHVELSKTTNQPNKIAIVCEKRGHAAMLDRSIGKYQWPIVESGGNPSITIRDDLGRRNIDTILYVGDYDPSGLNIERTWRDHFPRAEFTRVALTLDQIDEYGLTKLAGKHADSNSGRFVAEHGELFQVEVDAIPPDRLRSLVRAAVEARMDLSKYFDVIAEERRQRDELRQVLTDHANAVESAAAKAEMQ